MKECTKHIRCEIQKAINEKIKNIYNISDYSISSINKYQDDSDEMIYDREKGIWITRYISYIESNIHDFQTRYKIYPFGFDKEPIEVHLAFDKLGLPRIQRS